LDERLNKPIFGPVVDVEERRKDVVGEEKKEGEANFTKVSGAAILTSLIRWFRLKGIDCRKSLKIEITAKQA